MRAIAKKNTEWIEELFLAVKLARQKLSKYYSKVTPMTSMLLISVQIFDRFRVLRLCRMWDRWIRNNPEDETDYTTEYQEAYLRYVETEYSAKQRHVPDNSLESLPTSNLVLSAPASGYCQLSVYP